MRIMGEKIAATYMLENADNKRTVVVNDEIETIKGRLDKIERKLENDKQQINVIREGNHVLTKGMFALLEHGINGNNIEQMRSAKQDVEAYLINH